MDAYSWLRSLGIGNRRHGMGKRDPERREKGDPSVAQTVSASRETLNEHQRLMEEWARLSPRDRSVIITYRRASGVRRSRA